MFRLSNQTDGFLTQALQVHPWLRALLSFSLGSLAALTMPPYYMWFLWIVSLSGLYFLFTLTPRRPLSGFMVGWAFGFGYFLFGLHWIGNALLVEGNEFFWAWPLAVLALPLGLALFWGAAGVMIAATRLDLRGALGALGFAGWITFCEYLRGTILTGFPWNLPGSTWAFAPLMLQTLPFIGIYGLSWLTVLWASMPGYMALGGFKRKGGWALPTLALLMLCGALIWGYVRLYAPSPPLQETGTYVILAQPSILQADKWKRELVWEHFRAHIGATEAGLSDPAIPADAKTLVIWPETAITGWMLQDPLARAQIRAALDLREPRAELLTGILRQDPIKKTYGNAIALIDAESGALENIYDKHHLVPFGEYIPFQSYIPLRPVVAFSGFAAGPGPGVFKTHKNLWYSPAVCYEIAFPGKIIPPGAHADLIVNVTNDAWYGHSAGPHQHLALAILRAAEEGIPVARAANNGISAVIDGYGRVKAALSLDVRGGLSTQLPPVSYLSYISWLTLLRQWSVIFILAFSLILTYAKRH